MTRVLVAGGGAAGVAAAVEAARAGAKVSLLESSGRLAPNRGLLPYLLSGRCSADDVWTSDPDELSDGFGIEVGLGQRVRGIDAGSKTVKTAGAPRGHESRGYDALVMATGASCLAEQVKGISKPGVHVMNDPEDYLSLARSVPDLSHVAVLCSSAPLGLVTAQELSAGVKSTLFLPGALGRFSPGIGRRIAESAAAHGVEVVDAGVQAIVGMKRVEAVISRDVVRACDAVVVLPRSAPSLPDVDCRRGTHGGAIVDRSMRSSSRGLFAAGDCAELRLGTGSVPMRYQSSAKVMGETAGRNAAGGGLAEAGLSGSLALEVFGTQLCVAGLDIAEGRAIGLELDQMEDDGGSFRTSMAFERGSHRVFGVQAEGEGALSLSVYISAVVSSHATLEQVAHLESPLPPLSDGRAPPIRLTAGRFLSRLRG